METADHRHLRPAERIGLWSLALWCGIGLAAPFAGREAVGGVVTGGALALCPYALHLALARTWLSGHPRRSARAYLWFLWLLKWPIVVGLLWAALSTGFADPVWLCVGVGLVPVVATLFALRALLGRSGSGLDWRETA